jgi:hypothetical protein
MAACRADWLEIEKRIRIAPSERHDYLVLTRALMHRVNACVSHHVMYSVLLYARLVSWQ